MVVDLALRLLHIVPAILLAGGVFFMWLALVPALGSENDETRKSVLAAVRGKWAALVMATSALLLVTGLINAVRNILAYEYTTLPYHVLVTVKLVLGIAIMFITARLSGRSEGAEKFRERLPFWLTVNSALILVLIVVASTMRVAPKLDKPQDEVPAAVQINQPLTEPARL